METQYWVNFLNYITPTQKTDYEAWYFSKQKKERENHYFWFEHGKEKTFSKQAITLTIKYT